MPQPPQSSTPVSTVTNKGLILKFVKLALQVRDNKNTELVELLIEAKAAGMSLDDVLEMLT